MVASSNLAGPTIEAFESFQVFKIKPAIELVFLCLRDTHGALQNNKPLQPSGHAGYAHKGDMKVVNSEMIGFLSTKTELLGNLSVTDDISAIYCTESKAIFFPTVIMELC